MSITTQQRLDAYLEAEAQILRGQTVKASNGVDLGRPDLDTVRKEISRLQSLRAREVAALAGRDTVKLASFT